MWRHRFNFVAGDPLQLVAVEHATQKPDDNFWSPYSWSGTRLPLGYLASNTVWTWENVCCLGLGGASSSEDMRVS
jgi:hypothetical protein